VQFARKTDEFALKGRTSAEAKKKIEVEEWGSRPLMIRGRRGEN